LGSGFPARTAVDGPDRCGASGFCGRKRLRREATALTFDLADHQKTIDGPTEPVITFSIDALGRNKTRQNANGNGGGGGGGGYKPGDDIALVDGAGITDERTNQYTLTLDDQGRDLVSMSTMCRKFPTRQRVVITWRSSSPARRRQRSRR
jgi:hypothetical protein